VFSLSLFDAHFANGYNEYRDIPIWNNKSILQRFNRNGDTDTQILSCGSAGRKYDAGGRNAACDPAHTVESPESIGGGAWEKALHPAQLQHQADG
jgi:hypothetical protein